MAGSVRRVRIIDFGPDTGRQITHHDSRGVRASGLIRSEHVGVTVLHVEAGGEIGCHPAVVDQLFLVMSGRGKVQGGDETWQPIAAGQAAVWTAGEPHITRAEEPMTAAVVEMRDLPLTP